jgi:hypothetical protein
MRFQAPADVRLEIERLANITNPKAAAVTRTPSLSFPRRLPGADAIA